MIRRFLQKIFFMDNYNPIRQTADIHNIMESIDNSLCRHFAQVNQRIKPRTPNGCEECLQIGSGWVHLRLCLSCGHVGCCDSSPNKHTTKHFHQTKHPLVKSFEPGENWKWCYVDEVLIE